MTSTDDEFGRRLQERYDAPVIDVDPDVIVRRGRRRRTGAWTAAGVAAVVVVAAGLTLGGLPRPFGPGPAVAPPPEPADAEAALVISPATVQTGDVLAVTILNRGQADLVGGVGVDAERWDGRTWRSAGVAGLCYGPSWSDCRSGVHRATAPEGFPAIGFVAPPGGSSNPLGMSTTGLEPGRYRLTMSVIDTGGDAPRSVMAAGQFQVIAPPDPSTAPTSSAAVTPSAGPTPTTPTTPPTSGAPQTNTLSLEQPSPDGGTLYVAPPGESVDPAAHVDWWDGTAWHPAWDVTLSPSERAAARGELRVDTPPLPEGDYRLVANGSRRELTGTFRVTHGTTFVDYGPGEAVPAEVQAFAHALDASRTSSAAPCASRERTPLRSCGAFVEGLGAPQMIPWGCLWNGAVMGAELVVVRPTIEGAPIVTYYRTAPGIDGIDAWTDSAADPWGGMQTSWQHLTCPLPQDLTAPPCG